MYRKLKLYGVILLMFKYICNLLSFIKSFSLILPIIKIIQRGVVFKHTTDVYLGTMNYRVSFSMGK